VNLPVSAGGSSERPSTSTTSTATGSRPAEYSKLVRGQDVWLSGGGERTRRSILRCIQCGESFRSLPELTVHMVHTRHYTNIVGGPPSSSTTSTSGHVTSELPGVGSTHGRKQHQQQSDRTAGSGYMKTRKSPSVTSRESLKSTSPGIPMTSSWSPYQENDGAASRRTMKRDYSEYDVTPHRSTIYSPASLPGTETGRKSAGTRFLQCIKTILRIDFKNYTFASYCVCHNMPFYQLFWPQCPQFIRKMLVVCL